MKDYKDTLNLPKTELAMKAKTASDRCVDVADVIEDIVLKYT